MEKMNPFKWIKNFAKSNWDIMVEVFEDNPTIDFVRTVKDDLKQMKEEHDEKKRNAEKSTLKQKFFKWMNKDRIEDGSFEEDLENMKSNIIESLKTGKFKGKKSAFDFDFNFDDDNAWAENFNKYKGGIMSIKELKKSLLNNLSIIATKESLEALSPIESLNTRIKELSDDVIRESNVTDKIEIKSDLHDKDREDEYSYLRDKILHTINLVASNSSVEFQYKDVLADQLALLFCNKCDYADKGIIDENEANNLDFEKEDLIERVEKTGATNIAIQLDNKLKPLDEIVASKANDTSFNDTLSPEEIKEDKELEAKGEFVEEFNIVKGIVDSLIVPIVAVPYNLAKNNQIQEFENKHGSSFTFKQPMLASDSLSKDFLSRYSKTLEIKNLIEAKGAIEGTVARQDGGAVLSRITKGSKYFAPTNVEMNEFADTTMSYDEIISAFSESGRYFFNKVSNERARIYNAISHINAKNISKASHLYDLREVYGAGENGDFVDLKRAGLPTYMNISVEYVANENVTTFKNKVQTRNTTLGLQIIPRTIPQADVVNTLVDLNAKYFESVTVTKDEKALIKKSKNLFDFWKKKGDKKEVAALKSNKMADIINKINTVKTPLFHLVISYPDYMEIKGRGLDLMNKSHYERLMNRLPLLSITIADEDSDILYLSEGSRMSYIRHSMEDFIDQVGNYEKELKTILKYNTI